MGDAGQLCPDCKRSVDVCLVPVTDDWPEAARHAFEAAGLAKAATCDAGQAKDMARTGKRTGSSWCADRVQRHPSFHGTIAGLQRDVQGMARVSRRVRT